jgi:hypothetical protein
VRLWHCKQRVFVSRQFVFGAGVSCRAGGGVAGIMVEHVEEVSLCS